MGSLLAVEVVSDDHNILVRMLIGSRHTVQHMQPFFISTISSSASSGCNE